MGRPRTTDRRLQTEGNCQKCGVFTTNDTKKKGMVTVSDLNGELLKAVVGATDERKRSALRVLRGEAEVGGQRADVRETERFLTLKESAKRLGVSACSLWRWGVPGHDLGGRRRFRMTEIEAYLQSDAFRRKAAQLREEDQERRGTGRGKRQGGKR